MHVTLSRWLSVLVKAIRWEENCSLLQKLQCKRSTVLLLAVHGHQRSKIAATKMVGGLVPKVELEPPSLDMSTRPL